MVKVTLKYTLLGRLWSRCNVPPKSIGCGRSYMQRNSPKDEITNACRTWDLVRLWSKWHWHIGYWVASEVNAKFHDERLAMHGDIWRGIPSDAKWRTYPEGEILHVFGQGDIDVYIIGWPLKYMPTPMTIRWLWTELRGGEFPQLRNFNYRHLNIIAC
jgi:hypothetical protein